MSRIAVDGVLRCSRYSFGPNRLHYCGPDKNKEMFDYIQENKNDGGLQILLSQFKTLYPYLKHIASANGIADPFDNSVVEAYWLGNDLLENVDKRQFYRYLTEDYSLKKKVSPKEFARVEKKLGEGAVPHHSFHVFDVWRRTGDFEERGHTFESLDECRIAWGTVLEAKGPVVTIETERIELIEGKLALGATQERRLMRPLEAEYDIEQLKKGDIVSVHWGVICEKLAAPQLAQLKKYTLRHLELANRTI